MGYRLQEIELQQATTIFGNYWIRLSRIWRILQIKEGVIHRGLRPRWITPSEICRILHILRKPNSIIALLFIQNISPFLKEFRHFALCFSARQNDTTLSPRFLGQRFNNFQRAALLTSLVQYLVNSCWLWWIVRAVLTNQKRRKVGMNNNKNYFEFTMTSFIEMD